MRNPDLSSLHSGEFNRRSPATHPLIPYTGIMQPIRLQPETFQDAGHDRPLHSSRRIFHSCSGITTALRIMEQRH